MFNDDNETTEFLSLSWRDVLWNMVCVMCIIVVLTIPLIQIVQQKTSSDSEGSINQDNMLLIEMRWPDGFCDDVDLWVMAPGELKPVGYSNRGGVVMDLLRDDLGCSTDSTTLNYEVQFSRGIPNGNYFVNVFMYTKSDASGPVPITVSVTLRRPIDKTPSTKRLTEELMVREIVMTKDNQEQTVFRFQMQNNEVVPGSINYLQKTLKELEGGSSGVRH